MLETAHKQSYKNTILKAALVILPAVLLGVLAMIAGDEPPVLWGQQLAAWLLFAFLALVLRRFAVRVPAYIWGTLFLILLAATLFGRGADGVRRWLALGAVHVHAAMLVFPALLVVLCRMKKPYSFILGAAAVVCFQPDLSQLAAFCAAALPLVWRRGRKRKVQAGVTVCLCVLIGICLFLPAPVMPVPYTEGILTMLREVSVIWMAVGWISLFGIPFFFGYRYYRQKSRAALCLSIYYTVTILFVLSGSYPVPFMGFGLSPIAGYWLAFALMV